MRTKLFFLLPLLLTIFATVMTCTAQGGANSISLPIVFEKNMGQAPPEYTYVSRHGSVETLFGASGVAIRTNISEAPAIQMRFEGAQPGVLLDGRARTTSVTNYLVGNDPSRWLHRVPNFSQVVYSEVYPGIDVIFRGSGDDMEHDFKIAAGSNPEDVRFTFAGTRGLSLEGDGDLNISLGAGASLIFKRPVAYQDSDRGRKRVEARFVVNADGSVQFNVGPYDRTRELTIDPVFGFSTYLASTSNDTAVAITSDSAGNVYVAGYTSTGFPIVNGIQPTIKGSEDAYVAKLDPTGRTLLYSTYLGGSEANYASAIAIDPTGNIIVSGTSSSNDFPHAGALPALKCQINDSCFFVTSLTSDGSQFNYSGLIGGIAGVFSQNQGVLALDTAGNAYLSSVTDDKHFTITPGTLTNKVPGYPYESTFVMKVTTAGALSYSTIVPGNAPQTGAPYQNAFYPAGIFVDGSGQATIAGLAGLGLPTTNGVVQPTFPNDPNAGNASAGFVLQLNDTASAINYATYVTGTDSIGGLAFNSNGNLYVTGMTSETNLPVSANAYQKTIKPGMYCTCNSGFVVELNSSGTSILGATYLEGTPAQSNVGTSFTGIAIDRNSNVFLGGMTGSTDFPLVNPLTSLWVFGTSDDDMVLAEMSQDLSTLLFGSFLSSTDQVYSAPQFSALAIDQTGNLLVVGTTLATDFPTTPNSFQRAPANQSRHGFVTKLDMSTPAPSACLDSWSVNFGQVLVKMPATQTVHLSNCGNSTLFIKSLVSSDPTVKAKNTCGSLAPGNVCALSLTYIPTTTSYLSGTLTLTDNAVIGTQAISFSGQAVAPVLSPTWDSVDFGHLLVNTSGAPTSFYFYNSGTYPLTISSVSADGDFAVISSDCHGTLQYFYACFLDVTFTASTGGVRTGSLTIVSNDPVNPRTEVSLVGYGDVAYAQPLIAGLGASTAQIHNGAITIQVIGANFYPASVVLANGVAQPTTYLGSGALRATLSGDAANGIGEVPISVFTPLPSGGTTTAIPLTRFKVLNLTAAFLASAPGLGIVYASLPSWSVTDPNTVVPIHVNQGTLGTPIAVGNNPGLLALSSNGKYLFVVANQDQTVQRINLTTNLVEATFAFPPNNCSYCGTQTAVDLKGVPASPQSFVLALTGEVALYNGQGMVNYVPATYSQFGDFTSFAYVGNPATIYTLPFTDAQSNFFSMIGMNSQGLNFTLPQSYGVNSTTGAQVVSDGTLLYTSSGEVWNPATQTQTGNLPTSIVNATTLPNLYSLLMDQSSGHIFSIGESNSSVMTLSAFDPKALAATGSLMFPTVPVPYAQSLTRWGSNGVAFIAQQPATSSEGIYLLSSSLTASITANPVPKLNFLSPSLTPQGSSDFQIALNGSGFTETSLVNWNGSPLQTTYIAKTALTATVPMANVTSSGSASISVTNPAPAGGTSNKLAFTVAPLVPMISFSAITIDFPAQTVHTSSGAHMIAVQNPGTAPLGITSIQVAGTNASSFRQTNNCVTTLAAGSNCSVFVWFDPTTSGDLNASITFTDNANGSTQIISLTGTGH